MKEKKQRPPRPKENSEKHFETSPLMSSRYVQEKRAVLFVSTTVPRGKMDQLSGRKERNLRAVSANCSKVAGLGPWLPELND